MEEAWPKRQRDDEWNHNKAAKAAKHAAAKEAQKAKLQAARATKAGTKGTGKSKGKGKQGKKGRGGVQPSGNGKITDGIWVPAETPLKSKNSAGLPICYKYGAGKCNNSACAMLHICQICEEKHAWEKCGTLL